MGCLRAPVDRVGFLPSLPLSAPALSRAGLAAPLALYQDARCRQVPIAALCQPTAVTKVPPGLLNEPSILIDLEHCGMWGATIDPPLVTEIVSTRIRLTGHHLVTTRLRPYLGKSLLVPPGEVIGTPEWISLDLDLDVVRPRFLQLLLLGQPYRQLAARLSAGQQHPRIAPEALRRIEVPLPSLEVQDACLSRADVIKGRLSGGLTTRDFRARVDQTFRDHFGLDPEALRAAPAPRLSTTTLQEAAIGRDVRFSWRYHAPESRKAKHDLAVRSSGALRGFLAEPARLGRSVKPEEDYTAGTELRYLTMAGLREWRVDPEPCPELNEAYIEANPQSRLAPGDVLLARAGEGTIGKVGLVEEEIDGCFADFVIRLTTDRLRLDPRFLRYKLMTTHYQTLISAEKKGLGNNTNIFPIQIHDFPTLAPSMEVQNEVASSLAQFEEAMGRDRLAIASHAQEVEAIIHETVVNEP